MKIHQDLATIIREALRSLEQKADIPPDDPLTLELKRTLLLKLAELDAAKLKDLPPEPPNPTKPPNPSADSN